MYPGAYPAQQQHASAVTRGTDPVGCTRVARRYYGKDAAVLARYGIGSVQSHPVIAVVRRLKPVVVERKAPVVAGRRPEFDEQRLVLIQIETSRDVGVGWICMHCGHTCTIHQREAVGARSELP